MLAEITAAVHEDILAAFVSLLLGDIDGWFALFVGKAAECLRNTPDFRYLWQAEQDAVLLELARETSASIAELRDIGQQATQALERYGTLLDDVAEQTRGTHALLHAMSDRLYDTRGWMFFKRDFTPEGSSRFHAFNRAIPFQGRDAEMRRLAGFMLSEPAFS